VARKHFYLFYNPTGKKLVKDDFFRGLVAAVGRPPTIADYQAELVKGGVAEAKAKEFSDNWILKYRCETVYCQDIAPGDLAKISLFKETHDANAPLFAKASDAGERAFRWLPNFLPQAVRTGYFAMRRKWLNCAQQYISAPTEKGGLGLMLRSGMTNKDGQTSFPGLPAGIYYLSNLASFEYLDKDNALKTDLWFMEKEFKANTAGGKGDVLGQKAQVVDAKLLKNEAAPTFVCQP
jgi:hypothetical protein